MFKKTKRKDDEPEAENTTRPFGEAYREYKRAQLETEIEKLSHSRSYERLKRIHTENAKTDEDLVHRRIQPSNNYRKKYHVVLYASDLKKNQSTREQYQHKLEKKIHKLEKKIKRAEKLGLYVDNLAKHEEKVAEFNEEIQQYNEQPYGNSFTPLCLSLQRATLDLVNVVGVGGYESEWEKQQAIGKLQIKKDKVVEDLIEFTDSFGKKELSKSFTKKCLGYYRSLRKMFTTINTYRDENTEYQRWLELNSFKNS